MRTLLILLLFAGPSLAGHPEYLVHIATESNIPGGNRWYTDWGSGSLVDPQYVLTCNHNIELINRDISVYFKNGDKVSAKVFKRMPLFDLCVLKLDTVRYETPVKIAKQKRPGRLDAVTIWGFPGDGNAEPTHYNGNVQIAIPILGRVPGAGFWVDVAAKQGVSGGPAINGNGELVGVEISSNELVKRTLCVNTPQVRKILRELP